MSDFVKKFQFVGHENDDSDCDNTVKNYAKDAQDINPLTVLQILNPYCGINFHHCFIRKNLSFNTLSKWKLCRDRIAGGRCLFQLSINSARVANVGRHDPFDSVFTSALWKILNLKWRVLKKSNRWRFLYFRDSS